MAFLLAFRLNPRQPGFAAALAGVLAALAVALVPVAWFEAAVLASGLPALLPAAEPPLGFTARAALMLLAGAGVGGAVWLLLQRLGTFRIRSEHDTIILPNVRREDAHPDAPPRRPVRAARDLGEPMLRTSEEPASVPEVRPLPADLDVPLAAFDAAAIPAVPAEPVRPVQPLFRAPDPKPVEVEAEVEPAAMPEERIEFFPLPNPAHGEDASIDALLARFERGMARRKAVTEPAPQPAPLRRSPPPQTGEGLESTLAALRRMAARA